MIKTLTIAGLLLGLTQTTLAQEQNTSLKDISTSTTSVQIESPTQKPKAARITPELSLISSTFVGEGGQNAQSITKMAVGGSIDIGETNFVTETGILYRQIGASETTPIKSIMTSVETDLNYLSVPVAAKYYFSNQHESSFFAKAGLAPSLLIGNQFIQSTTGPNFRNSDPSIFAVDALVGLGGKFQLTNEIGLVLEISYWRGLTPVYSGSNVYTSNFMNSLGLSIQL